MSEQPLGPGWWQASDRKWYPAEQWTGPPGSKPPTARAADATPSDGSPGARISGSLTILLPEGWFAKENITVLAPDGQANVIVSTEPLDPKIDSAGYAANQGELQRKLPHYEEHAFESVTVFGDQAGFRRRFSWQPPDGAPVSQVQLYFAQLGRGVTATATVPATQEPRYEALLQTILSSLRLESKASA